MGQEFKLVSTSHIGRGHSFNSDYCVSREIAFGHSSAYLIGIFDGAGCCGIKGKESAEFLQHSFSNDTIVRDISIGLGSQLDIYLSKLQFKMQQEFGTDKDYITTASLVLLYGRNAWARYVADTPIAHVSKDSTGLYSVSYVNEGTNTHLISDWISPTKDFTFEKKHFRVNSGDAVFVYSDGVRINESNLISFGSSSCEKATIDNFVYASTLRGNNNDDASLALAKRLA